MKSFITSVMAVLSFPLLLLTQGLAEEQSDVCVGDAGISYICGLMNAEDLLSVRQWVYPNFRHERGGGEWASLSDQY